MILTGGFSHNFNCNAHPNVYEAVLNENKDDVKWERPPKMKRA